MNSLKQKNIIYKKDKEQFLKTLSHIQSSMKFYVSKFNKSLLFYSTKMRRLTCLRFRIYNKLTSAVRCSISGQIEHLVKQTIKYTLF